MAILRKPDWWLPERAATPENVYRNRRAVLRGLGLTTGLAFGAATPASAQGLFGGLFGGGQDDEAASAMTYPQVSYGELFPAGRNPDYASLDRDLTDAELVTSYNNYYEFGSHKRIAQAAQDLTIEPWTLTIDGLVEEERTFDLDSLFKAVSFEERLYRHRCVEAWAMAVPWTGFPMQRLLDLARPLSSAKYVTFTSFQRPEEASGQRQFWYPWPYVEGLTIDEAANELAFIGTGLYGKPMPKQNGAPLRLVLPWKYGFKSAKGIVRMTLSEERPVSFWQEIQASEYGFWANVNPDVPHPRWSQATERLLGVDERVPTQLYNGYAQQVAHLYKDKKGEQLYL